MSETTPPRVLFCAFAELPGPTGTSTRTQQWLSVFGNKSTDALCLKGERDPHIQRLGGARVMRVPGTLGKLYADRLSTYQRALTRQLSGESYDLVWCADLASAAVLASSASHTGPVLVEARGSATPELTGDAQKRQRDGERAILRSATRVLVPSRAAAKILSARVDPTHLEVVPGCVDRTVFTPPSMELSLDDEYRVVVFGGREGGPRLALALAAFARMAPRAPAGTRLSLLGAPTPDDDDVRARIAQAGLKDTVDLIDADAPLAVSAALSLAHVVVVIGSEGSDVEPAGLPHRALEAMACGRAVVVAGPEALYADAMTAGEHGLIVSHDADRIAEATIGLLSSSGRRQALGRAAARHLEATADLAARAYDIEHQIRAATGVAITAHEPRDDDHGDTSSRSHPFARVRLARSPPQPSQTHQAPHVVAAPAAQPSEPSEPHPRSATTLLSSGPLSAQPLTPMETVRMEAPAFSHLEQVPGTWEGDTFLDSGVAPHTQTNPDAAHVKAEMLVSSDAQRSSDTPSLTSMKVVSSLDSADPVPGAAADPWINDTIADGSPVETPRASSDRPPPPRAPTARSLLVDLDRPRPDLTAEDTFDAPSGSSGESDSSEP